MRRPHVRCQDYPDQSSSTESFDDAMRTGIARAEKTLRNLTGAWVKSQKLVIEERQITQYRVS